MRGFLTGFAAAAIIAVVPTLALAHNQEVAEQIANNLRNSGQMSDYKIGVKYQDGTAWLRGRVSDQDQMNTALHVVFQTPDVVRVVNELIINPSEGSLPAASQASEAPCRLRTAGNEPRSLEAMPSSCNPLRGQDTAAAPDQTQSPQRAGLAKRLQAIIAGGSGSEQEAPQPLPVREEAHARADRLASWFVGTSVKPTSAEESEDVPGQAPAPQRAKPVPQAARKPAKVAMMQPNGRCCPTANGGPMPMYAAAAGGGGVAPARYDQPCMPNYAWPSYASYPNYAAVTYPKQYSPTAWPYIGPFYPYPQVPLGWRKVTLEWDDGWWFLDFKDQPASCWHR